MILIYWANDIDMDWHSYGWCLIKYVFLNLWHTHGVFLKEYVNCTKNLWHRCGWWFEEYVLYYESVA